MDLTYDQILAPTKLPVEWFTVALNNNPAQNLPYHNNQHNLEVAYYAQKIGNLLGLSEIALTHLTVAGLFHDYNHTGDSEQPDKNNISKAVEFIKSNDQQLQEFGLNVKQLTDLIKATTFPHTKPKTLNHSVIADADLLFWVDEETTLDDIVKRVEQLNTEAKYSVTLESTYDFVNGLRFYTTPAWNISRKSLWRGKKEAVLQMFQKG